MRFANLVSWLYRIVAKSTKTQSITLRFSRLCIKSAFNPTLFNSFSTTYTAKPHSIFGRSFFAVRANTGIYQLVISSVLRNFMLLGNFFSIPSSCLLHPFRFFSSALRAVLLVSEKLIFTTSRAYTVFFIPFSGFIYVFFVFFIT